MEPKSNKDRLLRVIRGLQLIQRTNPPNSSIAKVAGKVMPALLEEFSKMPADAPALPAVAKVAP